jgi:hypothetical protein
MLKIVTLLLQFMVILAFLILAESTQSAELNPISCGISAGRDANHNVINCNFGLTSDQIKELTEAAVSGVTGPLLEKIEALSKKIGVSEAAVIDILRELGLSSSSTPNDIIKNLTVLATEYKRIEARVSSLDSSDGLAAALIKQVRSELSLGKIERAGELLDDITTRIVVLNGSCNKLVAMGLSIEKEICLPQIMNVDYKDGRVSFTFSSQRDGKTAMVSFSGPGSDQIALTKDDIVQPVSKVVFTFEGSSDHLNASGTCAFSNAYKGVPSNLSCSARTSQGLFLGEFLSNGVSPDLFEGNNGQSKPPELTNIFKFPPLMIDGKCLDSSHVASGHIGEDLTKFQSRFYCDSVIIMDVNGDPNHKLVQFTNSRANHQSILGFGGLMEGKLVMIVKSVFLEIGRALVPNDGACRFFYKGETISAVVCGAQIDEGKFRTVPLVQFESGVN